MADKLELFRKGVVPEGATNHYWPLFGAGLENLGVDGHPAEAPLPAYGPDELLVRHDACGLCFSDIKVIKLGQEHPRIFRDIKKEPVVLGHEVCMTVVGVGEDLRDQYRLGDRFIIQADIWTKGVNLAYGYMIQGGLSQYGVIDQRILNGDDGNYLIPVKPETGYAESALTEPWACVTAAYELEYRTGLKAGGTTWVIGTSLARGKAYTIGCGFDTESHPDRLILTGVPPAFEAWLRGRAAELGVEVLTADVTLPNLGRPALSAPNGSNVGTLEGWHGVDDIVLLCPGPDLIEAVSPHLADFGICAIMADAPLARKVNVDIGRVHYNRWVYVGATGPDIARAYSDVPVLSSLKPVGRALFVGAGGPMGRMHVQRAIQVADGPSVIVCTDVSDLRLRDLFESFSAEAAANGIEFVCLNPTQREEYEAGMARFRADGFDDIIVLAPVASVISDAATWVGTHGVMNVFAGVARGTMAQIDLSDVYLKQARHIGHSASSIEDLRFMLFQAETGTLSPNRSVAAVGSLGAVRDGLQAVMDTTFPGKVVIYPHLKEMPLTAVPDLKDRLPTVYARLKDGREWTTEAENEFLRLMLDG
jgi:threonine dehydrogenase-like Zn-dependent dehydrogenase